MLLILTEGKNIYVTDWYNTHVDYECIEKAFVIHAPGMSLKKDPFVTYT